MGLFDDLIPKKPGAEDDLSFDDLIPKSKASAPPAAPLQPANSEVAQFIQAQENVQGLFDDLVPPAGQIPQQSQTEALTPTPQTLPSWLTPPSGQPAPPPTPAGIAPPVAPTPSPSPTDEGPGGFMRGLVSGTIQQNPELAAEALEAFQQQAPEAVGPSLGKASTALRDLSKLSPTEYALRAPSLRQLWTDPSFSGAVDWAGETLGSGIASMAPSIATGVGGAAAGGAVAGPPGAVVGGIGGALVPSYAFGVGEVYKELKKEGIDPKTASNYAMAAGGLIAGLDVIPLGPVIKRLGGTQVLKQEVSRALARRIAAEGGKGMTSEGITEAAQEAIKIATVSATTDKPFWTEDNLWAMAESGVGGALTGGVVRGGTGVIKDRVQPSVQPATEDAVDRAYKELTGGTTPVAPELAEAAPVPIVAPLQQTVQEKGPEIADAQGWKRTVLENPEMAEVVKLPDFLDSATGPISKQDVLTHIEENVTDVKEDFHTYSPQEYSSRRREGPNAEFQSEQQDYLTAGDIKSYHEVSLSAQDQPLATVKMTERNDMNNEPVLLIEDIEGDTGGTTIKRMMRWAADRGYRRIAVANGDIQSERYAKASPEARRELKRTYDKDIPSRMKHWARKVGGNITLSDIPIGRNMELAQLQDGRFGWRIPGDTTSVPSPFYDLDAGGNVTPGTFYANTQQEADEHLQKWYNSEPSQRFTTIDIPGTMRTDTQAALPIFSGGPFDKAKFPEKASTLPFITPMVREWADAGDPVAKAAIKMIIPLSRIINLMGLKNRVKIRLYMNPTENFYGYAQFGGLGSAELKAGQLAEVLPEGEIVRHKMIAHGLAKDPSGKWGLHINVALHKTPGGIWATMVHELGHIFMFEKFHSAPLGVQHGLIYAYKKFIEENPISSTMRSFIEARDNMLSPRIMEEQVSFMRMDQLDPEKAKYWRNFDEWAAEQVARWATTAIRPVTVIDQFFAGIARNIRKMIDKANEIGKDWLPNITMQSWLDSFASSNRDLGVQLNEHIQRVTQQQNQKQINKTAPEVTAAPRAPELQPIHDGINRIFDNNPPVAVAEMGAWADKFNKFYKWMISVVQLAALNPHIEQLQRYVETMRQMHLDEHRVQEAALRVAKAWRGLGREQARALTGVIDEVMNFTYLTDQEKRNKVRRHPTRDEFGAIVDRYRLSRDGVVVFQQVRKIFADFLTLNEQNLETEVNKITDPVKKAKALDEIRNKFNELRKAPYFPAMRFGEHTVVVRDAADNILHFELVEGTRFTKATTVQRRLADELAREYALPRKYVKGQGGVQVGVIAKDARPMLGMPGAMLDLMAQKLELSHEQRQIMEQLKFEASPAQSFKHRFRRRNNVPGYSEDFQRAFAGYFFHGAKFYTKVKYAGQLRDYIGGIREQAKYMPNYVKRMGIANFMSDHLQQVLDPKPDFAALRGMMFTWALGFSPAAASLNLTQIIVGTYPYLASKFGDAKTVFQMGKAGTNIQNFYKRGTYEGMTEFHWKAISEGIKQGTITEAMAPELAALTDGNNLGQGFGGNRAQQAFTKFQEMSSFMFEMAEQVNRRITFRAALELALADPANPHIDKLVGLNRLQYERLLAKGWSTSEARAYLVAQDAVNTTQYEYARWAQPRFMRGKMRTVFVFKTFIQNTMFMLANNPSTMWRSMLVTAFIGGAMGLPGADDIEDLLKGIGYKLFGKDFDLKLEARKYILEISNGKIPPDLLLHGLSRRGFGIPAILDGLGNLVGRGTPQETVDRFLKGRTDPEGSAAVPFPVLDRSKAVGFGRILPIEIGKLFQPMKDSDRVISQQIQNASGAAFGVFFNIYRAIADTKLEASDPKRWERAVPRALGSLSRSYRAFTEGRERNRSGATVVNYDIRDPEQFFEALALAGGYNNLRQSAQWDRIVAEMETQTYWDIRRSGLLKQYYQAEVDKEDLDIVRKGIDKFNQDLPQEAKDMAITSDTIKRSVQARQRAREAQESGVSVHKTKRGLQKGIQELFPESTVDVRRIR